MRRITTRAGVAIAACLALSAGPALAGSNSETLSNGAELTVSVTSPVTGDTYLIPAGSTDVDVPIAGDASIGEGAPNVHWTYVIDVSGSAGAPCAGGTVLDCEKTAVSNLNSTIVSDGSAVDVGLSVFGAGGVSADMAPDAGDQPLEAPANPNVGTVIGSVVIGGVNQFTPKAVNSGATNFTAGLQAALVSVQASTAASKNVVFLSDGLSNQGGGGFNAAVAALDAAGATIYSFAVGAGSSCLGGTNGTLQAMADATGGSCTGVPNPADLPDIVQNVTATELQSVSLTVDAAATAFDSIAPAPPFDGPGSTSFTATAADQLPGAHEVCATATGTGPKSDPASQESTTVCETYQVFGFALDPATATNELGVDNEHTVTATLSGAPGQLEGWPVDFAVTGQNAGATGVCDPVSCETDTDGVVTFTYTVPVEPASLGTDTITATVTIDDESGSLSVEKIWEDTTPPVAMCVPGPNPSGKIPAAPGNGGQGQNQDGFYTISATDDVWGPLDLSMFVTDDGTGTVFGPLENPSNIKYTEANGATPSIRDGSGAVDHQIKGQGDALITAVDGSGNVSEGVSCLVPPAPQ